MTTDFALIEATLDRQSAAITRMVQRQPHVQYNHTELWNQVDAAKKELRAAQQPIKNDRVVSFTVPQEQLAVGHYEALPKQIHDHLKSQGIPVIGDWLLRGVEYGALTVVYNRAGVCFTWHSLGEEPEVDPVDELI